MLIGRRTLLAGLAVTAGRRWAREVPFAKTQAARLEGTVTLYTSIDLAMAEIVAQAFHAAFPDLSLRVERAGSGRISQRIEHGLREGIAEADVVQTSDASCFASWKSQGVLDRFVADDVERYWPAEQRDPDGHYASVCAQLGVIAYDPTQVRPSEAPRGFGDLLDPRWHDRLVKAHPGYSGTALTITQTIARTLGWQYFVELARQDVLQLQCTAEPPRIVAQGVRTAMADGGEAMTIRLQRSNAPMAIVYPAEGAPLVRNIAGIMRSAPHPSAARLLADFLFSRSCQNLLVQAGGFRSFHTLVPPVSGQPKLEEIRLLRSTTAVEAQTISDTQRYRALFEV